MGENRKSHENNFDAVRLLAALTVLVGHSWSLTGRGHGPEIAGVPAFTVAVWIFFSLSGYLIATSWNRSPKLMPFLARRGARIFPALLGVVVATTVVIGPAMTTLPLHSYFSSAETWQYLTNVTLVATYELPGVFETAPKPVVNGSLWTLGPEFSCYVIVALVGMMLLRLSLERRAKIVMFASIGVVLAVLTAIAPELLGNWKSAAAAAVFFMAGAVLAQTDFQMPLKVALALLGCWMVVGGIWPDLGGPLAWIALPPAILAVGLRSTPVLRRAGRFGDLSYGIYLWGFPIQQVVAQLAPDLPLPTYILLVLTVVTSIALASWWVIERPALNLVRAKQARRPSIDSAVLL